MAMSTRKMGIRRRFLQLMFSAVLLSFIVLSAVLLHSMYRVQENALESGRNVGEAAGEFTEALAENHAKQKLLIAVTENAHHANRELFNTVENATYIALDVGKILSNPDGHLPQTLKVAGRDVIHSGECYVVYGAKAKTAEDWAEVEAQSRIAANVAETLEYFSIYYSNYTTSCFFVCDKGYMIVTDSFPEETLELPEGFWETYDPTERAFYKEAKQAGNLISQVYRNSSGLPSVMCALPCFVEGEFVGIVGIGVAMESLYHEITALSIGDSGINFALNQNGRVVFSSEREGGLAASAQGKDLREADNEALAAAALAMTQGKSGVVPVIFGEEEYYLAYAPMPVFGWSFGSLARKDEVVSGVQAAKDDVLSLSQGLVGSIRDFFLRTFRQMAIFMAVIFALVFFLSQLAANHMVRPILTLTEGVGKIAGGNLDTKLSVRTGDELEELSDSVNQMTDDLKLYMKDLAEITEEKERIHTELEFAQNIQEGMLPSVCPNFSGNPHYDLFATMDAAKAVGGDFYDFYALDENHIAVTMADVSGKGIPAALFMVIAKTILKNETLAAVSLGNPDSVDWGAVLGRMNRQLCDSNEEMMFVTVFFGVLNTRTGDFSYVNGGHNPPLLGRTQGEKVDWQYIRDGKKNRMVGAVEASVYEGRRLTLSPGDMFYLYTDGVTEAMDEKGELYTEARLQELLDVVAGKPQTAARDVLAAVRRDIDAHVGDAEQSDDITMLAIRYLRPETTVH